MLSIVCARYYLPLRLACGSVALPMMDVVEIWMNEEGFRETPGIPVPLYERNAMVLFLMKTKSRSNAWVRLPWQHYWRRHHWHRLPWCALPPCCFICFVTGQLGAYHCIEWYCMCWSRDPAPAKTTERIQVIFTRVFETGSKSTLFINQWWYFI